MKSIAFMGQFGNEYLPVRISPVGGSNGQYHVLVNKFYQGSVVRMESGEWLAHLSNSYISSGDDLEVIIDLVIQLAEEK